MTFDLDGFEIGERLGAGGFGEVWQARQLGVDRPVAIKIGNTPISDAADQLRFERECKALGRLSTHANIVTVYTSTRLADGRPVLVLEFVDGGTLQHWAMNNPSTEPQLLNLGADLTAAVAEAHRHEILHRDLKPQNVLLRTTGEAILADFGIAQLQDGLRTVTGNVTASAAYAAPEVLDGERAGEQADLYGIGICLLAAATQTTPFTKSEDDTLYPVLTRVLTEAPPDLTALGYSAELNSLIQRLLAKKPADRPDSALSVLAEFQGMNAGLHRHQRVTPSPIGPASEAGATTEPPVSTDPPTQPPNQPAQASVPPAAVPAPQQHPPMPAATPNLDTPAPAAAIQSSEPATAHVPAEAVPTAPGQPPTNSHAATGAPVGAETSGAPPHPASVPREFSPQPSSTSPALIAGIVGAVVLAAVALFFLFGRSDPESATPAVTPQPETQTAATPTSSDTESQPESQDVATPADQASTEAQDSEDTDPAPAQAPREPLPVTEPVLVADSIDVALDFREYPINLVAGQEVSVEVHSLNAGCARQEFFDLRVQLLDPNREQVGGEGWPGNSGCVGFGGSDWMATQDGTYTIRFFGGQGGFGMEPTGTYEATIATLTRQSDTIDPTELVTIEGSIDRALDSTSYEIDGRAGQIIGVGMHDINGECARSSFFNLRFALFDPNDEQIGDSSWPGNRGCDASGRWPLEVDGVHTLVFYSDDDTGTFTASVGYLQSEVVELDAGERVHPVQHEFVVPRDEVFYEIDLAQGQAVSVQVSEMNGSCSRSDFINLYVRMIDSDGEPVGDDGWPGNSGCQAFGPWEAPAAGTYRVHFYEATGTTGAFEATIGRLGG